MAASSPAARRKRAVESFGCASSAIGPIEAGMSLFAITRGQWSMIDAVLHCLDQVGPAKISIWTWTVAEYEIECMERLCIDGRIKSARLILDNGTRNREERVRKVIVRWREKFGSNSVLRLITHAKIATIESDKFRLLLRGSMNLNFNPQFEQFDLTEGGADFDLVRHIESELPILAADASCADIHKASKTGNAFDSAQLKMFNGMKVWNN